MDVLHTIDGFNLYSQSVNRLSSHFAVKAVHPGALMSIYMILSVAVV